MPKNLSSILWDYFEITSDNKSQCKLCPLKLSRTGGGPTTSLRKHLEVKHKEAYNEYLEKKKQQESEDLLSSSDKKTTPSTARKSLQDNIKQQSTLDGTITKKSKWNRNDPNSRRIDRKIARMIALDDQPFQMVENLGFMQLMQEIPLYELKSRTFYKNEVLSEYDIVHKKVFSQVQQCIPNGISFTTDIWSNKVESLFSLTAHSITEDWKLKKWILHASPLCAERHTGDHLSTVMEGMLSAWNIPTHAVHAILRDNGTNIVKALKQSALPNVSCAAHNLNLIVKAALDQQQAVENVLQTCRKIAGHFHLSDVARKKFVEIQRHLNPDPSYVPLKLMQESPTRWNSTLTMAERIFKLKDAIILFATEEGFSDWILQWNILEKLILALQPFNTATEKLSHACASASDIIPTIRWIEAEISGNNFSGILSMVECLRSELSSRFTNMEAEPIFAVATALDPRYKEKYFQLAGTSSFVRNAIERAVETDRQEIICEPAAKKSKTVKTSNPDNWNNFFATESSESEAETHEMDIGKELNDYFALRRIPVQEDKLQWWLENKRRFPLLSTLARRFLAAPPTSVPSEQLFSGAGLVYNDLRSRLAGDLCEKLLFLKYNLTLIEI